MTEQELREKIANRLALDFFVRCLCLPEDVTVMSEAKKEADRILAIYKEAGYVSPEECEQCNQRQVETEKMLSRLAQRELEE